MKYSYSGGPSRYNILLLGMFLFPFHTRTDAQTCPSATTTSISAYPNTYYPGTGGNLNAGSATIPLGPVNYGSTPISSGDVVLIIQMQGAHVSSANNKRYGSGMNANNGSGYLSTAADSLMAGVMEFATAASNVPLTGGTLTLAAGLKNNYRNSPFATFGQYTYQVIRVPIFYNLSLSGPISVPAWTWAPGSGGGGFSGGVLVLYAVNNIALNSQTIAGTGIGFRGGAGVNANGGSGSSSDFVTLSTNAANGSKGEGIAGTPRLVNSNNSLFDNTVEGYPSGSYAQGAPGNAGGGGTDGNPSSNDQNTGGGGGGNGGTGGVGGNSWSSNLATGGRPGATFAQVSPSRLVMGGGGGAGTINDNTGTPSGGLAASGAAGGGNVILMANAIVGPGTISVNGADGNTTVVNDGAGGGGAGGSVLLYSVTGSLSNITVTANGGAGGSNEAGISSGGSAHGPGGGGGGGVIYSNASLNAASSVSGGIPGTTWGGSNYGAAAGNTGIIVQNITQSQTLSFPVVCVVLSANSISLTAEERNGQGIINWEVSGDQNVKEYIVEKSWDGATFSPIYTVLRGTGAVNNYNYLDDNIFGGGLLYYRIKERDISGVFTYSKTASINVNAQGPKLSVFPNPASGYATIRFYSATQHTVDLRLFDLNGAIRWQRTCQVSTGLNTIPLDNVRNISNGIYILKWFDGLRSWQVKFLVNH